jgi:zinc D-Ala-D-Ala carboxypeptidase
MMLPDLTDFSAWPNFKRQEFACSHTGQCRMDPAFLDWLQKLRTELGFPFHITSGYRHPTHPKERNKKFPGAHALGVAVDIRCTGAQAFLILRTAFARGVTGVGVQQPPGVRARFVHLDLKEAPNRPTVWTY